jgi:hypothetical protein
MRGGAPRMHLTSRSVKGERMRANDRREMRGAKAKGGVSGGYVDHSVVTVGNRHTATPTAVKKADRRRERQSARKSLG